MRFVGATVIKCRFFNQEENLGKFCFMNITHIIITTSNCIKFLIGVNYYGDLHLDVSRC